MTTLDWHSALARTPCHSDPLLMQKVCSSDEGPGDKLDVVSCGSKEKEQTYCQLRNKLKLKI